MRIVYVDKKCSIEEPETSYPSLVDAVAALDKLFKAGLSTFGQILSSDGAVLKNVAPGSIPAVNQEGSNTEPAH